MTYSNKYISDSSGRCFKISAMTETQVGSFIKTEYHKLKHIKERLNSLHDHLLILRLEHTPNATKPDLGKKDDEVYEGKGKVRPNSTKRKSTTYGSIQSCSKGNRTRSGFRSN